ncbi:MAG: threonine ammonia-lyase [bacterium]
MDLSLSAIKEVAEKLEGIINHTQLYHSTTFSELTNNNIYMKAENFQKTGSFKIRGAYNKISRLCDDERKCGVIAASAGNHAQGVALAASKNGISATIVMPKNAPMAKVTATQNYGADVILYGNIFDETYQKALELQKQSESIFIHPFNDLDIIAGQGTIALEILEQLPETDIILAPIGGGGLISGIAIAAKAIKPDIEIIGVEASNAASMKNSINKGFLTSLEQINTIADGISIKTPGDITFNICKEYLDDIITVTDEEIAGAILMLMERTKMVVEGAGATVIAALLNKKLSKKDKTIVPVLSGGNIDFNIISRIIERGLIKTGRKSTIKTCIKDKPGSLSRLLSVVAVLDANIISINHDHYQPGVSIDDAEVELEIETRNKEHAEEVFKYLKDKGYFIKFLQ